jgi:hypothetical protein
MNMKIKRSVLNKIIKEELDNVLKLVSDFADLDKFTKEKEYHDDEEYCDDEIVASDDISQSIFGSNTKKRKHPTEYLSGGANEKSVSDNIMMGGKNSEYSEENGELPAIVLKWQRLAESKRR